MTRRRQRNGVRQKPGMWVLLLGVALVAVAGCVTGSVPPASHTPGGVVSAAAAPRPWASSRSTDDEPRLTGGTFTLVVHGLACPACAAGVETQLRQIRSVKQVTIDPVAGIVRVAYDPATPPSRKDVLDAVRWGGATVITLEQP